MPIIEDIATRQEALNPTQSFIVQAPAGSGKTELLTQRYLVLLSHAEKAPEEIVAITFTRKSAAEMRARIMHALAYAQQPEPDSTDYRHTTWRLAHNVLKRDEQLEWQLSKNPNRLRILTIDALSAFLCRQTPLLTQFGGMPAITENATAYYTLAAKQLLTHIASEPQWQPILETVLLHLDNNTESLIALFSALLNQRDQWLPHIMFCHQNHGNLRELLEDSLKNIAQEKLIQAAKNMPHSVKQTLVLLARHAGEYLAENDPENPIAACADFIFEEAPELSSLDSWIGLAKLLLTKDLAWRKRIDKNSGFTADDKQKSLMLGVLTELSDHDAFHESLADIVKLPPIFYTDNQWEVLTALVHLLPLLAAQLSLVFQEKGEIDFTQLNLSALKALGSEEAPTDLALYLDYQIRHLLIDEFQDTSVVHLNLLKKMTMGWLPDDGRTLFVVGDPMQSIYRFRNAEVGLFLRAQQRGINHIALKPLTLTMNFRSQKNLVSWFNETFDHVFPKVSDIATGRVPYTHAKAAKSAVEEQAVELKCIVSDNPQDEADYVVARIKSVRAQYPDDKIAILVRSRRLLAPIVPRLKAENIAFQSIDIETLGDRPEVQDCISLARALLHRADRIAWLSLLRAPFCGLTLHDLDIIAANSKTTTLWQNILSAESFANLSSDGLLRLKKLRGHLQHAFETQYDSTLTAWIETTWTQLGGPACLSNTAELNFTRAFFNLILQYETNSTIFSIEELILRCNNAYANTEAQDASAIQIMTIHKSKGLEFDHVFLPGLQSKNNSATSQLFQWMERSNDFGNDDLVIAPIKPATEESDPIFKYLSITEAEKQDYETTRLLYVATTRAKKILYLSGTLAWDEKKSTVKEPNKNSFLGKLWPAVESIVSYQHANQSIQKNTEKEPMLFSRLSSDWHFSCDEHKNAVEKKTVTIDIALHPQEAKILGTTVHEMLQWIAQGQTVTQAQWISRLQSLGMTSDRIAQYAPLVHQAITNAQSDARGAWILSPAHQASRCEWALTYTQDKETKQVIIDRSFIDENNNRWIIDYKTSMPKENESLDDFLQKEKQAYQAQLEQYAQIVAKIDNRPIKLGLYFPLCMQWISWEHTK